MSRFILGNCIDVMRGFPDRAVDLIVTDPPYFVGFKDRSGRAIQHQPRQDRHGYREKRRQTGERGLLSRSLVQISADLLAEHHHVSRLPGRGRYGYRVSLRD